MQPFSHLQQLLLDFAEKQTTKNSHSHCMSRFLIIEAYHCFSALETDAALHLAALALARLSAVEGEHGAGGRQQGDIA